MTDTKLERGPMVGRMLEGDFEKDTITFHMPATYYLANGRYIIEPESDWLRRKEQLTALSARASAGEGGEVNHELVSSLRAILAVAERRNSPEWNVVSDTARRVLALTAAPQPAQTQDIDAMVSRFLGWRLPDDLSPDCGISFTPCRYGDVISWPVGTNLLSAIQAKAMFKYVLAAGAPTAQKPLDESANNAGVATGSRNDSSSESVTRGSLPPSSTSQPAAAQGGMIDLGSNGHLHNATVYGVTIKAQRMDQLTGCVVMGGAAEIAMLAAAPQPQEAPFRNLPDGATFEDYRDQLAVGNLTPVDQIGFDNLLHDELERLTSPRMEDEKE